MNCGRLPTNPGLRVVFARPTPTARRDQMRGDYAGSSVIAPLLAVETSFTYLASRPLV